MPHGDRPRPRVVLTWAVGVVVLLGALGAAGPQPVTAALPLPPADTSEIGATGRLPDAGLLPVPPDLAPGDPLLGAPLSGSGSGVPETMLAAYRGAETSMGAAAPDCHLSWALVAGIGKVESSHAYGGAVGADGSTTGSIRGPQLDGTNGNAAISDTDGGALDQDTVWDRAVGPTQFIPTSWRTYGADGNGDGTADPDNAFDAALATGRYLCAGGTDLATASGRHDAVFRYNHSESYVATVLRWADAYASGALPVPDTDGGIPDATLASGSPSLAAFPTPGAGAAPADPGLVGGSPVAPPAAVPAPAPPALPAAQSAPPDLVAGNPLGSASAPGGTSSQRPGPAPNTSSSTPPAGTKAPVPPEPAPARPSTTAATSSDAPPSSSTTTPPGSTTPTTTPFPAAERCTASLDDVATAFGFSSKDLKAVMKNGPKGQVTCTVTRGVKALVEAVVATTDAAPSPPPGAVVSRKVEGGRVVLAVPPTAGIDPAAARTALEKLASAWT